VYTFNRISADQIRRGAGAKQLQCCRVDHQDPVGGTDKDRIRRRIEKAAIARLGIPQFILESFAQRVVTKQVGRALHPF
jgi:hypothetical protein